MSKVTVLGSGAWGTTLAQVLCDSGQDVLIWGRNSDIVNEIKPTSFILNSSRENHMSPTTLRTDGQTDTVVKRSFDTKKVQAPYNTQTRMHPFTHTHTHKFTQMHLVR